MDGNIDGDTLGKVDGFTDVGGIVEEDNNVGVPLGVTDGEADGTTDSADDGLALGKEDGLIEGP